MVSEKVIVVLIILAMVLSIVSIAVTISTVNTKMIPQLNINRRQLSTSDEGAAKVSIIVQPSPTPE